MKILHVFLGALAIGAVSTTGAQIQRLDLPQMVDDCDHAVYATIVACRTDEYVDPVEGIEHITTLTLVGESLYDGSAVTVDVSFHGGFEPGQINSEAPIKDDCRVGSDIVAFYTWTDRLAAGVPANALHAAHGGIYRTVASKAGAIVLGRGDGFAVNRNVHVSQLRESIAQVRQAQQHEDN